MTKVDEILQERGTTHGSFDRVAECAQALREVLREGAAWRALPSSIKEGLDMLCLKMARAACSNGLYDDTFQDMVGYSKLMLDEVDGYFQSIRDRVHYDPETGEFTWKKVPWRPDLEGTVATHQHDNGYLYIKVGQKIWTAARLAYFLQTGVLPLDHLVMDHIDRDKTNNRWSNLRLVSLGENSHNSSRPPNEAGLRGVSLHRKSGLYRARYQKDGNLKSAYFETPEEAHQQYLEWGGMA